MKKLVVLAAIAFAIVTAGCAPAEQAQEKIVLLPPSVAAAATLPDPGQVGQEQLPAVIQEAKEVIRSRLPAGQPGDNQFSELMKAVNRLHNRMLQPELSGRMATTSAAALRAVYTLLYRLANKDFFFIIVPIDDCTMMMNLGLQLGLECSPQS